MSLKPLGKRVLIQREAEQTTTASGIILPENAKEKPLQGKVLNTGAEVKEVKTGETVVFGKFSGVEITVDDEALLILEEKDILGIVE